MAPRTPNVRREIEIRTADPTATDDASAGILEGTTWVNTANGKMFVCVVSTASAAVWVRSGPARDTIRFQLNGKPTVSTGVDGVWMTPAAGVFRKITLYRRTAGSGGSMIVDVNKEGTTIYTTQGNRPTVTQASGNDQFDATTDFDVATFGADERIELDIDQVESGNPQDATLEIEVEYT